MERLPYYQIIHVLSLLVLATQTFMAFANPLPENKRRTMIITGIAALLMFISGFGMITLYKIPFVTPWVLVKLACWIGLSAMAGIAYRRVEWRGGLSKVALGLLIVAVLMVYLRPSF